MNRRQFVTSSSLGIAGLAFGRSSWAQPPAAQAPPVTKFEDLRRGVCHRDPDRDEDECKHQRLHEPSVDEGRRSPPGILNC